MRAQPDGEWSGELHGAGIGRARGRGDARADGELSHGQPGARSEQREREPDGDGGDAGGDGDGGSFVYNASGEAASAIATGVGGANISGLGTFTYSYTGTGSTTYGPTGVGPSAVGTYQVSATFNTSNPDYTRGSVGLGGITITPAALTITANSTSKTYGQAVTFAGTEFTTSGLAGTDTVTSVTLQSAGAGGSATVAGSPYSIVPSNAVGTGLGNYTMTYLPGTLTVNAAQLTITANSTSKTYGQTLTFGSGSTAFTSNGLQNGETIGSVTLASTGAVGTAPVGSYAITPSAATGGTFNPNDYAITYLAGALTVNQASLTITASSESKTYGQTLIFGSGSTAFRSSGLQNGETIGSVTLSVSNNGGAATAAVGDYAITPSAATGGTFNPNNYTITYATGTLTVNPASLTITANSTTKAYGQTLNFAGTEFATSTLYNGDSVTSVTLTSTGAAASATVAGSPYSIVPSTAVGTGIGNYKITYVNGTLAVTKAALTITAKNAIKTYGQTVTFAGTEFTANGLMNGDNVTSMRLSSSGAAAAATVADSPYSIIPSNAVGNGLGNYAISYVNGMLTVNTAPATVTPNAVTKVYGQADPTLTGTLTGFLASDNVTATYARTAGNTVGGNPYTISATLNPAGVLGNYNITYNTAAFTITPAPLSVTASSASITYGGTVPTITASYSGFENGDTVASLTAAPTCSTTATSHSPVGSYPSTCSGAVDTNYTFIYVSGTVTDTVAPLIIKASSATMTYGGPVPAITPTYSGFVSGDTASSLTMLPTCSTTATSTSPSGVYPSSCSGAEDNNYNISYINGTVSVTPGSSGATLAPNSLTFQVQTVGTSSSPQTVTLTNTGTSPLNILGITIGGYFYQTNNCGTVLSAGASCSISVIFKPIAPGLSTGSVSVYDNAAGSPQTVMLNGTGLTFTTGPNPPVVQPTSSSPQPGQAPLATLSSNSLVFATQMVGSNSGAQIVQLTNTGKVALTVLNISASGDFLQTNTCGTAVGAGASCAIFVTFEPDAAGARTGALIVSDNATGSPQMVALSGTGIAPAVGPSRPNPPTHPLNPQPASTATATPPVVRMSSSSLVFLGQVTGTSSKVQIVTITNSSDTPLVISGITASGDFTQTNNCASSLEKDDSCDISVTFKPDAAGAKTGTLTISEASSDKPQTVTLSGTGLTTTGGKQPQEPSDGQANPPQSN